MFRGAGWLVSDVNNQLLRYPKRGEEEKPLSLLLRKGGEDGRSHGAVSPPFVCHDKTVRWIIGCVACPACVLDLLEGR